VSGVNVDGIAVESIG